MKRLICAALAMSLLGGSGSIAQAANLNAGAGTRVTGNIVSIADHHRDRRGNRYRGSDHYRGSGSGRYGRDRGHYRNRWYRGGHYRGGGFIVRDYHRYHLHRPPYGYHWVYADGNFLLVAIATSIIADVLLHGYYR